MPYPTAAEIDSVMSVLDTVERDKFQSFVMDVIYPGVETLAEELQFGEEEDMEILDILNEEFMTSMPVMDLAIEVFVALPTHDLDPGQKFALGLAQSFVVDHVPLYHFYLLSVLKHRVEELADEGVKELMK